ncbi:MAG: hypothetical protein H7Z73_12815 [Candidatus Saccharibacteria bacterium]|nr:hypothetical protein [Moraxellaceae bacterium]
MEKLKKEFSRIDSQFHGSAHVPKLGTKILLDLGFSPIQTAELCDKTQVIIAATLVVRQSNNLNHSK